MLRAVEILTSKLPDSNGEALVERALFDPPRIEPEGVLARHTAGTGQQAKVSSEACSILPERCGMEIPARCVDQRAKVDVDGAANAIPGYEARVPIACDVCEIVTDVL